ncbi:MAG: histidinol-phosphate transaminase [Proteobacteria bacterium]|nr:histidinol-phosphate transaminase [Pseudomonadota bacterium]
MSFDPEKLVNPKLLQVKPYQPGKPIAECQRELGLTHFIKMASNENPLGTSELVKSQLAKELVHLSVYPDGNGFELKTALSKHHQVKFSEIILGNGSEDVIKMAIQTFVWGQGELLIFEYAFGAYKILAEGLGFTVKEVPSQQYGMDLAAMMSGVTANTKLIIFANPNNPTGSYINHADFVSFMNKLNQDVMVLCDEAYYEYMVEKDYPQTLTLLKQYPNLIITRTFSKANGLAGLRVGYAIADERVIDLMNHVRQPFNVNHLAQVAALMALQDQDFVKQVIRLNEQGKTQFADGLKKLNLSFLPCHGNFFTVEIPIEGINVFEAMLKQGIIIRPLMPYRMKNYYRITIGTFEQNEACLNALKKILHKERVV